MRKNRPSSASEGIGRREFIGRAGLVAGVLATGPAVLAACGSSSKSSNQKTPGSSSGPASTELVISNWPLYIDKAGGKVDGKGTTIQRFEAATGIHVKYTEDFNDNDEYFAKIQPDLAAGNRIDPDIFVPTYWLTARLISVGWLEKLPLDQIPNAKNVRPDLQKPAWDPTGEFSMPWQSGMTGIAYNLKVTGRELKSTNDLFDPKFKGKIGMLTEMRDTVGLVARSMNIDTTKITYDQAKPVFDKLEAAKAAGQIRRFTGNDYQDDLVNGNFAACIGWSGDVAQLALDNKNLRFVIPDEGGMVWSDTMVVPKKARHIDAAAKWMNFVYDPVNAARITAAVQYVPPCQGVQEELRKLGGDSARLADSTLLFPDAATTAKLSAFGNLSDSEEQKFNDAFTKLTTG